MKALAIAAAFLVTILVAFLVLAGIGMGETVSGKAESAGPTQSSTPPPDANGSDGSANSRKFVPGYFPSREESGLPPAKPCESCKNKHRK
jgi:hypothetical protein